MASTKFADPPKEKAMYLKPEQVPEVIPVDSRESENDSIETMDGEDDYEQFGVRSVTVASVASTFTEWLYCVFKCRYRN
jgi:hypothetical protein